MKTKLVYTVLGVIILGVLIGLIGLIGRVINNSYKEIRPKAVSINLYGDVFVGYSGNNGDNDVIIIKKRKKVSGEMSTWRIDQPNASGIYLRDLVADDRFVYLSVWQEFRESEYMLSIGPLYFGTFYKNERCKNVIIKLNHLGEEIARWDGTEAIGAKGLFHDARGLALWKHDDGNVLYIADTNNHSIRGLVPTDLVLNNTPDVLWGQDTLTFHVDKWAWEEPELKIMPIDVATGHKGLVAIDVINNQKALRWLDFRGQEIDKLVVKDDLKSLAIDFSSIYVLQGRQLAHYTMFDGSIKRLGFGVSGLGNGYKFTSPQDVATEKFGKWVYVVDAKGVYRASSETYSEWNRIEDFDLNLD